MARVLLFVILAMFTGGGSGLAGTLVEFPNLPGREPTRIIGYLARPDAGLAALMSTMSRDAPPYPAVVVLHGCGGISSHSIAIADRLGGWGYVALTIDTLGSRGMDTGCYSGTFVDQAFDAYAALRYLSTLKVVDSARVALLGQSMGGSATLYAIDHDLAAQYFDQRFRAAIAYYPGCVVVPAPAMTAPVLILIGEADQWNKADGCKTLRYPAQPDSASIDLIVYPGVHHAFDVAQIKPARSVDGRWIEFDELVARDAEEKTRAFLAAQLGSVPTGRAGQK